MFWYPVSLATDLYVVTWSRQNCMFITVRVTYNRGGDNITHTYAMRAYSFILFYVFLQCKKLRTGKSTRSSIGFRRSSNCWFLHTSIYPSRYYSGNEIFYISICCLFTIFFFFLSCKISKLIYHQAVNEVCPVILLFLYRRVTTNILKAEEAFKRNQMPRTKNKRN